MQMQMQMQMHAHVRVGSSRRSLFLYPWLFLRALAFFVSFLTSRFWGCCYGGWGGGSPGEDEECPGCDEVGGSGCKYWLAMAWFEYWVFFLVFVVVFLFFWLSSLFFSEFWRG